MSKQPVINKIKGDKELRDPFLLRILRSFPYKKGKIFQFQSRKLPY